MPPADSARQNRSGLAEDVLRRLWFGTSLAARIAAMLLAPLALLTSIASRRRRDRIRRLPRPLPPVIVVGNLVVGGAGKTPLVIALARALSVRGHAVGLLCSGYRAPRQDARIVGTDSAAEDHGDEAVLLARAHCGPVAAGRNRGDALNLLVRQHPELTVILSDDGLQHVHLPRSVGIAVFDRRGIGNGRLLPAGPLRESLDALSEVDALALNGPARAPVPHPRIFGFRIVPHRFIPVCGDAPPIDAAQFAKHMSGRSVTAIAGIGEPQRFFDTLHDLGLSPRTVPLPDHAAIDRALIASLPTDLVLMTAKDAVKCVSIADPRCWALEVSAEPDPQMIDWLTEVLVGLTPA